MTRRKRRVSIALALMAVAAALLPISLALTWYTPGIYLWHFGVVVALDKWGLDRHNYPLFFAVTFVLTTACAAVSYYVVERPFLAFKDRRTPRRAPMVAPATAE